MIKDIEARIKYPRLSRAYTETSNLDGLLNKDVDFDVIDSAIFNEDMMMAVVKYDKDHCMYILVPGSIFRDATSH